MSILFGSDFSGTMLNIPKCLLIHVYVFANICICTCYLNKSSEIIHNTDHVIQYLTHSMMGKIFCRRHIEIFLSNYFSQETQFDISCKLSPICMKCQILFPGINKKNSHQFVICRICPESGKG